MKSLVVLALLFTLVEFGNCCDDTLLEEQRDFSMLSCTEIRNITIVMEYWHKDINDKILPSLNDLIKDESCFFLNFYLNSEDRVVRVRKSGNLANIMERNNGHFNPTRLKKLINRLHEEELFGMLLALNKLLLLFAIDLE